MSLTDEQLGEKINAAAALLREIGDDLGATMILTARQADDILPAGHSVMIEGRDFHGGYVTAGGKPTADTALFATLEKRAEAINAKKLRDRIEAMVAAEMAREAA
jgi:hypothetical protein